MDEGKTKAIPLRRGRSRVTSRRTQVWLGDLAARAQTVQAIVFGPPRQLWLASLGGTALTIRNTRAVLARMVAEGAALENRLLDVLPRSLRPPRD